MVREGGGGLERSSDSIQDDVRNSDDPELLRGAIDLLEDELDAERTEKEQLKDMLDELSEKMTRFEQVSVLIESQTERLQSELKVACDERDSLRGMMDEQDSAAVEVARLRTEYEVVKGQHAQDRTAIGDLEGKLRELQTKEIPEMVSTHDKAIKQAKEEAERAKSKLRSLGEELQTERKKSARQEQIAAAAERRAKEAEQTASKLGSLVKELGEARAQALAEGEEARGTLTRRAETAERKARELDEQLSAERVKATHFKGLTTNAEERAEGAERTVSTLGAQIKELEKARSKAAAETEATCNSLSELIKTAEKKSIGLGEQLRAERERAKQLEATAASSERRAQEAERAASALTAQVIELEAVHAKSHEKEEVARTSLETRSRELSTKLEAEHSKAESLAQRVQAGERRESELDAEVQVERVQAKQYKERAATAELRARELEKSLSTLTVQVKGLEEAQVKQLEDVETTRDELRRSTEAAEKVEHDLRQQLRTETSKAANFEDLAAVAAKRADEAERVATSLKSLLEELKASQSTSAAAAEESERDVRALGEQLQSERAKVCEYTELAEAARLKADDAEREVSTLTARVKELEAANARSFAEAERAQDALAVGAQEAERREEDLERLLDAAREQALRDEELITDALRRAEDAEDMVAELRRLVTGLEKQTDKLLADAEDARSNAAAVENLREQLYTERRKTARYTGLAAAAEQRAEEGERRTSRLKAQLDDTEVARDGLIRRAEDAESKRHHLEEDLKGARAHAVNLEGEIQKLKEHATLVNSLLRDARTALRQSGAASSIGSEADEQILLRAAKDAGLDEHAGEANGRILDPEHTATAYEERARVAERRVSVAEQRMVDAEARATKYEGLVTDAEQRLSAAERRVLDAEQMAANCEHRATTAERKIAEAEKLALGAEEWAIKSEKRADDAERVASDAEWRALLAEERAATSEERAAAAELAVSEAVKSAIDAEDRVHGAGSGTRLSELQGEATSGPNHASLNKAAASAYSDHSVAHLALRDISWLIRGYRRPNGTASPSKELDPCRVEITHWRADQDLSDLQLSDADLQRGMDKLATAVRDALAFEDEGSAVQHSRNMKSDRHQRATTAYCALQDEVVQLRFDVDTLQSSVGSSMHKIDEVLVFQDEPLEHRVNTLVEAYKRQQAAQPREEIRADPFKSDRRTHREDVLEDRFHRAVEELHDLRECQLL